MTGSLNYARASAMQTLLPDGRVLIAGGNDGTSQILPSEIYDPVSGTWTVDASLSVGVYEPGLVNLGGGRVLLTGGWVFDSPPTTTAVQLYTPAVVDAFSNFQAPLNPDPSVWNTGNAGRTYAVKWQLRDATGAFVTDAIAGTTIVVGHVTCPTGPAVSDPIDYASSAGGTALRYDATSNQYLYNWASPRSPGCYAMTVTTPDGVGHRALFELK